MYIINSVREKFCNLDNLNKTFRGSEPFPHVVLDNFFPEDVARSLELECQDLDKSLWTQFTRLGSYMEECNKIAHMPVAFQVSNEIHSKLGLDWLGDITGISNILPDPHLIGAGYSRSYNGDSLKIHTDFNWNDTVRLHRRATMIIYLSSQWQDHYGGEIEFWDKDRTGPVVSIPPLFNRCVIWENHNRGFHGYPRPITCPNNLSRNSFRLFFYSSQIDPSQLEYPHRSLYWYDNNSKIPYDIKT
ncbi:MAG: 2OG-Fe(II) oxygenase [Proteobacteria bacterium]|nr:2OG-Fe(II) oxygenase [Pseudomonadota bacterium]NBP14109.1 2OG-Fe(II) oxygenase [bacterium]